MMKTYQVIYPTKINVDGKMRVPEEQFEADPKEQEIKSLVREKFIQEV
jgi:hypothetical protein